MFKSESSQFKEQLATVSQWFQQWTDCEQTIALCTLLKQLDSRQARFIEQLLQDLSSTDPNLEDLEQQANSIGKNNRLTVLVRRVFIADSLLRHNGWGWFKSTVAQVPSSRVLV